MERDPLALTPSEMRELGYRAVDLLVEREAAGGPALRRGDRAELARLLDEPAPEEGRGSEALERLFREVVPYAARIGHPRYLAYIPSSGTWPGALGDFVASAVNVYSGTWIEGSGATQLELTVLGWFKDWIGYPADADGQLTSGGSQANLQALACARELRVGAMRDDLVLYVADQGHSSIARAARTLGFRPEQVRVLPTDRAFRLRPETLAAAIDVDTARGLRPLAAAASAGATNTGAVDRLELLAEVAHARDVWLHVDAAYGGFAVLTGRGREALEGIEHADSVTMDPHKWLHQSYECGALLVRQASGLRSTFEIVPPYLQDSRENGDEVNFGDHGLQLSRTSRAFKVWLSIQTLGLAAFRAAIDRSLDLAEHAATRIERSAVLELAAPLGLGVVCFRRAFPEAGADQERLNAGLVAGLEASGRGFVSSTMLRGEYCIRLCPLSHATTQDDVDDIIDFFEQETPRSGAGEVAVEGRFDDVRDAWLAPRQALGEEADPAIVAAIPLFAGVSTDEARELAALSTVRAAQAGECLARQWDATRDFCVILEGEVEVRRDGAILDRAGAGEFFGEISALDWGRGYGYARTATVTAITPVELLVFPEGTLGRAMRVAPALAAAVRRAVAERLPD